MFNLCLVQDIKDRTKTDLGTTFDTVLTNQVIPSVTLQMAQYCRRPDWDKIARTVFINPGLDKKRIFLASPPVAASPVIQVFEDTALPRVYGAATLQTLDKDYFLFAEEGIIIKNGYAAWAEGLKTVKSIYTGGYLTANGVGAPVDLVGAAVTESLKALKRVDAAGIASQSVEGASISFSLGLRLDLSTIDILNNYRVWPDA